MTDEERRRTMEFILEQQAQFAANIQRFEEDRIHDLARRAELQTSFQTLVELCRIHDIRLDDVEFRSKTLEEAVRHLDVMLKKNQAILERLQRDRPH